MGFGVRPPQGLGIKIHECGGGQGGVSVYIYSYLGIYLKKISISKIRIYGSRDPPPRYS